MTNPKKILIIIQRSNGDVFLSRSLIEQLQKSLRPKSIDLLVNDDTLPIAKLIPHIGQIYTFSYLKKKNSQRGQERGLIKKIIAHQKGITLKAIKPQIKKIENDTILKLNSELLSVNPMSPTRTSSHKPSKVKYCKRLVILYRSIIDRESVIRSSRFST